MVNKPLPPIHPATKQPLKPEDLFPIFAEELCRQELDQENAWFDIPEEVRRQRLNNRYKNKVGDDNEVRLKNDAKDFKDFSMWDLRLESEKSVDEYINNLSPKSEI